jgi:hypothetical protein
MERKEMRTEVGWEILEEKPQLKDLCIHGRAAFLSAPQIAVAVEFPCLVGRRVTFR